MDPTQVYETLVINRDESHLAAPADGLRFLSIPARSLSEMEVPPVEVILAELGIEETISLRPLEAWSLPFLLDSLLGNFPDFPWRLEVLEPGSRRKGARPSSFAQHLAYSPLVPFESSPLGGVSMAQVLTSAGTSAGAAVGIIEGKPLLILAVPLGIIITGAARGVSDALHIGIRAKLLGLMGVRDPAQESPKPDGTD